MKMKTITKWSIIIVIFVLIAAFTYGVYDYIHGKFYGTRGIGESYGQARGLHIVQIYIPPQAKKINYNWMYGNFQASFEISESDFIEWAQRKGWQLQEIRHLDRNGHGVLVNIPLSDPYDPVPITIKTNANSHIILRRTVNIISGYFYENNSIKGLSERFIYDKDKGVGYFQRASD